MKEMNFARKVWIASKYFEKGYGYDQLRYGDDLYGHPDAANLADEISGLIDECEEIGRKAWREKYSQYNLY